MRYVQFLIAPADGSLHPLDRVMAEDEITTRRAIHRLKLLTDDTVVGLYEFEGDVEHLENMFANHPDVISFTVSHVGSTVYSHARTRPNETVRRLLRISNHYNILTEMPIEYTDTGDLRVVTIAELETFKRAIEEFPTHVGVRIEHTGTYLPGSRRLFSLLTERQRETVRTAVDLGYFEEPRQVTYQGIANEMGISPETVGEHLRKAEAKLVPEALP